MNHYDITMGSFDVAEICELVGFDIVSILNVISKAQISTEMMVQSAWILVNQHWQNTEKYYQDFSGEFSA